MRNLINKWCQTRKLSIEDAIIILKEYYSLQDKTYSDDELIYLLQISQQGAPINWLNIIKEICYKNNISFVTVQKIAGPLVQDLWYYIY